MVEKKKKKEKKLESRRGGEVYVAFRDYSKVFHTVDRDKVWETREKLKTSSKMVNILKLMIFVSQIVRKGGCKHFGLFFFSSGCEARMSAQPFVFLPRYI